MSLHGHFEAVERCASSGASVFHRASPASKLAMLMLCILTAWSNAHFAPSAASALLTVTLTAWVSRLGRHLVAFLIYPVVLGSFFAALVAPTTKGMLVVISRLAAISSCVALVASTTPAHLVLGLTAWLLPPVVNDSLLATYRGVFVLLERLDTRFAAARMRGLRPGSWRDMGFGVSVAANLLVSAFDDAGRLAEATGIRANGPLAGRQPVALRAQDWAPLSIGLVYVGLALAGRWAR